MGFLCVRKKIECIVKEFKKALAVALPSTKDRDSSFKQETIRVTVKTHPGYIIVKIRD